MELNQLAIVHLDLYAFSVSIEYLKNNLVKGKALIGEGGEKGVVAACSYESGKHSAMPVRTVLFLYPQTIEIFCECEDCKKYSQIVTEVIKGRMPYSRKHPLKNLCRLHRWVKNSKTISEIAANMPGIRFGKTN